MGLRIVLVLVYMGFYVDICGNGFVKFDYVWGRLKWLRVGIVLNGSLNVCILDINVKFLMSVGVS